MAKTPREVEIKFAIPDLKEIATLLRRAGFRIKTKRTHELNVLYDLPDGSLRRKGEILRIRKYGDRWTLTHKARTQGARHKTRVETETDLDDGAALDRIFRELGFSESFRYEKFRTEWTDGKGEVVVDETPIGNIGEIEGRPRWIDATAKTLGIHPEDYNTKSYAELFFDWKRQTGSPAASMTFAAVGKRKRS